MAQGGLDSPARLAQALGEPAAQSLWEWSGRAVGGLQAATERHHQPLEASGSWRVAVDEAEWSEWQASAELLTRWTGAAPELRSGGQLLHEQGLRGVQGGLHLPDDVLVDPIALLAALRASVQKRCRWVEATASVDSADSGRMSAVTPDNQCFEAELLVVACGHRSVAAHPWFDDKFYPLRLHGLELNGLSGDSKLQPGLARHRFEAWIPRGTSLEFVGCRWAEGPELGAGETACGDIVPQVLSAQRAFLSKHLPESQTGTVGRSWCGIATGSCDGLPLVGSLPGMPRIHCLGGWSGWGLSAIAEAARSLSCGLLGRRDPHPTPPWLSPRRML